MICLIVDQEQLPVQVHFCVVHHGLIGWLTAVLLTLFVWIEYCALASTNGYLYAFLTEER